MPRINNIPRDGNINAQDRLLGAGAEQGTTYTYLIDDLAEYFANRFEVDGHIETIAFTGYSTDGTTFIDSTSVADRAQSGQTDRYTITYVVPGDNPGDTPIQRTENFFIYNGADGLMGATGQQGDTGMTGPQGLRGETGPQGAQGAGITDITDNGDGTLTITFGSGGTMLTTGSLTGPAGATGATGPRGSTGRGIQSVSVSAAEADGTRDITITYSDATSDTLEDALMDGDSIASGVYNSVTDSIVFTTREANTITVDLGTFGTTFVRTSGDQTVGGVKTFTDIVRGATPVDGSDDTTLATTEWVRDHIDNSGNVGQNNQTITTSAPITGSPAGTDGDVTIGIDQTAIRIEATQVNSGTLDNARLSTEVPTSVTINRSNTNTADTATITGNVLAIELTPHQGGTSHDTPDPAANVAPGASQRQANDSDLLSYAVSFIDRHGNFTYLIDSINLESGDGRFIIPAIPSPEGTVTITKGAPGTATFRAVLQATHVTDSIMTEISAVFTLTALPPAESWRHGVLNLTAAPAAGQDYSSLTTANFVNGTVAPFNRTGGANQDYALIVVPTAQIDTEDFTVNTDRWEFLNRSGFAFAFERDATDSYIDGTDLVLWFRLTVNERFTLTDINV